MYHKLRGVKQHEFLFSQFPRIRCLSTTNLGPLLRISISAIDVSSPLCFFLKPKVVFQARVVVDKNWFLSVGRLKSLFLFWLSADGHSHWLEATLIFLPGDLLMSPLTAWQLTPSLKEWPLQSAKTKPYKIIIVMNIPSPLPYSIG